MTEARPTFSERIRSFPTPGRGAVSTMKKHYFRSMHLDNGAVQEIEPLMLVRYSPGVAFIVKKVQIDRDRVRL